MILRTPLLLALALAATLPAAGYAKESAAVAAPSLDGFSDSIDHWRGKHGKDYPRHAESNVMQIADNLLRYQRKDGGWQENQDPLRILDEAEQERIISQNDTTGGSFDNRNIYTQVDYLASAYALTGDARYRDASLRGLEFILSQQIPGCGGWPHAGWRGGYRREGRGGAARPQSSVRQRPNRLAGRTWRFRGRGPGSGPSLHRLGQRMR